MTEPITRAEEVLANFEAPARPLYLVGLFARGVTVYSQQVRALNLIWALVERGKLVCQVSATAPVNNRTSIAIIGGGFAGLTAAAALIRKSVDADITIFEQRDTLMPLQHGSDTRWLHPRIYNWPADESESAVADLPVLNWTAARASDVVAQILLEWSELTKLKQEQQLTVYCNAQHLQIYEPANSGGLIVEWVGDKRNYDGSVSELHSSVGETKNFDHVIVAIGYGLEKEQSPSYWRNDTLGQPSLAQPRRTYLVSGQGDGAMIEVLRLRISQYRQDRILDELIVNRSGLHEAVKVLREKFPEAAHGMFEAFEALEREQTVEFAEILSQLTRRLRRDTDVILHLKKHRFAELFSDTSIKIAFQNRLLVYLLYKCGGFVPSFANIDEIVNRYGIPKEQIVYRHGTQVSKNIQNLLSDVLQKEIGAYFGPPDLRPQDEAIKWPGGYFGFPGDSSDAKKLNDDEIRKSWRKEYLPAPTALAALSHCTAIAGFLLGDHPLQKRLRVTLHRTRMVGKEPLLQQCCEYVGTMIASGQSAAGRTFPIEVATIGLSYRCRKIVRSVRGVTPKVLRTAMDVLELNNASREMSPSVGFVLAIPILQPETAGSFSGPSPVAGVLFIDSEEENYFIDDVRLRDLVNMIERFVRDASSFGQRWLRESEQGSRFYKWSACPC